MGKKKQQKQASEPRTLVSFDWAMKRILRDKANFDILEGFLSALLCRDITVTSLLESEGNQEFADSKYNRVDIKVEDEDGEEIIIEIQYAVEADYLRRLLFGVSKVVTESVPLGESFSKIPKIISVSIIYFPMQLNEPKGVDYIYHYKGGFWGTRTGRWFNIDVEGTGETSIETLPEYYIIEVPSFNDKIINNIDEWAYLFKHSAIKSSFHSKNIQMANDKLDWLKMSPQERHEYEKYQLETTIRDSVFKGIARANYQEGKQDGIEIGATNALRNTLRLLLVSKFGELPETYQEVLEEASSEQLNDWFQKALTATQLSELEISD